MRTVEKTEYFYEFLPRFVTDLPEPENEQRLLPVIERRVERDGILFDFIILPASVLIDGNRNEYFYPGATEERVEKALRILAVSENPNFSNQEKTLNFSTKQLITIFMQDSWKDVLNKDQIDLSLNILCNTSYQIIRDERAMIFRPLSELTTKEKDDEIYYKVRISPVFFNSVQILNLCFGTENLF